MISVVPKVGLASAVICAVVACASTPKTDQNVVNSLERCASFMKEVESNRWPSAGVIDEGTKTLRRVFSGEIKGSADTGMFLELGVYDTTVAYLAPTGSVNLAFDPVFALRNCAELFAEHGKRGEAREMETAARWYKQRNLEAFNRRKAQLR